MLMLIVETVMFWSDLHGGQVHLFFTLCKCHCIVSGHDQV